VQEIIAREMGLSPVDIGYLNPRPPVRPVPMTAVARHTRLQPVENLFDLRAFPADKRAMQARRSGREKGESLPCWM